MMDGRMDGLMDGRKGRWADEQEAEWTHRCVGKSWVCG